MKVLMVNPHIFSGGAEKVVLSTAHWLNKFGIHCDVLTLSLELEVSGRKRGIRFLLPEKKAEYWPNVAILSTTKNLFSELQKLLLSIKSVRDDYDIFNPHSFPAYLAFGFLNTPSNARVVWTCHDILDVYGPMRGIFEESQALHSLLKVLRALDRRIVTNSIDAIVTVSTLHANEVMRAYGRRPYVIPPAIEFDYYAEGNGEAFRDRYGLSDTFLCVHVGSLIPRKGQEISLKAIAALQNRIPELRLAVIGTGPDMQKSKKLALDLGIKENVIFTGKISDDCLRDAYHAADVNLLPSTLESFGLTSMEALASGTVSIVSNETGVSECLHAYGIGYILRKRTPTDLAESIVHVYKNPEEARNKAEKAREILCEKFSWKSYVERLLEVYKTGT